MTDHTPGAGTRMLLFDFNNNSQNDPIYSTTVNVIAGKVYFFSAWFANVAINNYTACGTCPGGQFITNSPILKFRIAGVDQGTVNVDSLSNNWNQFFTTWTATATTSITIEIINLRGGNQSNDLALDDISFTDGCDKITNLSTLGQSSALIDTVKMCNIAFPYSLNPGLPGSYNYSWRNSAGALLSAPATNPTYSVTTSPADGTKYYLCYEFIPGCPRRDSVIFRNTPLAVELGSNKVMCAPVNIVLNSGATSPPVTIQWLKNGSPVATTDNYTATDVGTYSVNLSRAGCGSATDNVTITSPTSSISGTGTYCAGTNTAQFTATGSTQIKWYTVPTGGTALNPGNTNPTITTTHAATNTTTPGCSSGLYAEDVSSYPGTLMPSAPCGTSNTNGDVDLMIEVNQVLSLSAFDFFQNPGWGNGTFTFTLLSNNPTGGPWCGTCTPAGNKDGVGSVLYTETSPTYTQGASAILRTFNLTTPQTLTPGNYWLRIKANGTALGVFSSCSPAVGSTGTWASPIADNTGNNVLFAEKALFNNNVTSTGGMFNIKFQVGASNACSRLFICAVESCVAPVDLISFTASKRNNHNALKWATASEENSAYFSIERSVDGVTFEEIGKTNAAGNSSSVINYAFNDYANSTQTLYYRLKQVDLNGDLHYSEIVKVESSSIDFLTIHPNPVGKGEVLEITMNEKEEKVTIEILDSPGRILSSEQKILQGESTLVSIQTDGLASGLYHLRVKGNSIRTATFVVE
jgi:hypothetical protein